MMTKEKTVGEDIVSFQQCKRVRWFLYHGDNRNKKQLSMGVLRKKCFENMQ